jgi:hypothetical protein
MGPALRIWDPFYETYSSLSQAMQSLASPFGSCSIGVRFTWALASHARAFLSTG